MPTPQSTADRRRARSLRVLAETIESLPLMHLDDLAGVDTWRGPRPLRSVEQLHDYQHRLHEQADELRRRAWWLDARADELDRLAAAALPGIA